MEESDGTIGETGSVVPLLSTQNARQKEGYARLREALGVVAWENAVMRGQAVRPTRDEIVRVAQAPVGVSAGNSAHRAPLAAETTGDEKRDELSTIAPADTTIPKDDSSNSMSSSSAAGGKDGDADAFWEAMMSAAQLSGDTIASEGADLDGENLSNLVRQARAVREAGNAGTMTGQERQEAALRVAMQMAALMGIDDDE